MFNIIQELNSKLTKIIRVSKTSLKEFPQLSSEKKMNALGANVYMEYGTASQKID